MGALKNGDEIDLIKFGDKFYYIDGNGQYAEFSTSSNAQPYKVYTALLSQSGTDAPTSIVLENTFGEDIVWVRDETGNYEALCSLITSSDGYSSENAFSNIFGYSTSKGKDSPTSTTAYYTEQWFENGKILLSTSSMNRDGTGSVTNVDDALFYLPIEIRVYT